MTHTVLANTPDTRRELHSEQLVNTCATEYMLCSRASISVVITGQFLVKNRLKQDIFLKSLLKSQLSSLKQFYLHFYITARQIQKEYVESHMAGGHDDQKNMILTKLLRNFSSHFILLPSQKFFLGRTQNFCERTHKVY